MLAGLVDDAPGVDVAHRQLVAPGRQVPQPQPLVPEQGAGDGVGVPGRTPRVGDQADVGVLTGGQLLQRGRGRGEGRSVVRTRDVHQQLQPQQQHHRLLPRQAQRPADGLGVADPDDAALPVRLDQVVGQVSRRAADEQQLQILDDLLLGDLEVTGELGQRDARAAQHERHHRQQP